MCSRCRTLWPACTGWRWWRRTGMQEAWGSNKWCTDHLGKIGITTSSVLVLSVRSPARRMNLNSFFPNWQLYPRGNTSTQIRQIIKQQMLNSWNNIVWNGWVLFIPSYSTTSKIFRWEDFKFLIILNHHLHVYFYVLTSFIISLCVSEEKCDEIMNLMGEIR